MRNQFGGFLKFPNNANSNKITQEVREYAAKEGVEAEKALEVEMAEKAKEFTETGSEIYHGNLPEGAKHDY